MRRKNNMFKCGQFCQVWIILETLLGFVMENVFLFTLKKSIKFNCCSRYILLPVKINYYNLLIVQSKTNDFKLFKESF